MTLLIFAGWVPPGLRGVDVRGAVERRQVLLEVYVEPDHNAIHEAGTTAYAQRWADKARLAV